MKPIVVKRQWWRFWRHPVFPWGWLQVNELEPPEDGAYLRVDGQHRPYDSGGGLFVFRRPSDDSTDDRVSAEEGDGGVWIVPDER